MIHCFGTHPKNISNLYDVTLLPVNVKFKKLTDTAIPFKYIRKGDACMDMYADMDVCLSPSETVIVKTGIAVEIPEGFEGLVRGRSGLASRGIHVHLGTIESTYRGDVGVIVTNNSLQVAYIHKGNRIAQFTVKPVYPIHLTEVEELSETERGEQGYGSSGE